MIFFERQNSAKILYGIISDIRSEFEQKSISRSLLGHLYQEYNPVPDIDKFIDTAFDIFPRLNCGVSSVYMNYVIGYGEVKVGLFRSHLHSFLMLPNDIVADITADQYGGPKIYLGPLKSPWSLPDKLIYFERNTIPHDQPSKSEKFIDA